MWKWTVEERRGLFARDHTPTLKKTDNRREPIPTRQHTLIIQVCTLSCGCYIHKVDLDLLHLVQCTRIMYMYVWVIDQVRVYIVFFLSLSLSPFSVSLPCNLSLLLSLSPPSPLSLSISAPPSLSLAQFLTDRFDVIRSRSSAQVHLISEILHQSLTLGVGPDSGQPQLLSHSPEATSPRFK